MSAGNKIDQETHPLCGEVEVEHRREKPGADPNDTSLDTFEARIRNFVRKS